MIRAIAAIDNKRGIANDRGIPWQGKVPSDTAWFRDNTMSGGLILMGYGTYTEFSKPLHGRQNFVATHRPVPLREGFTKVTDARKFLKETTEDVWNIGGAVLFAETLDMNDELYLTKLQGDFQCTKFFPEYDNLFELASESKPITENGITFTFCVYRRK
ncbi:MAG TPA: dihydrofolate reductase [Candidatus Saccharimonadales bacterium]|nr:dihydrofolate reductase [Candidatus Saccharimonadales bacterium]